MHGPNYYTDIIQHDPMCRWTGYKPGVCECPYIADIRADEQEKAAQRVRQCMEAMQADETDIEFVEAAARGEGNGHE